METDRDKKVGRQRVPMKDTRYKAMDPVSPLPAEDANLLCKAPFACTFGTVFRYISIFPRDSHELT